MCCLAWCNVVCVVDRRCDSSFGRRVASPTIPLVGRRESGTWLDASVAVLNNDLELGYPCRQAPLKFVNWVYRFLPIILPIYEGYRRIQLQCCINSARASAVRFRYSGNNLTGSFDPLLGDARPPSLYITSYKNNLSHVSCTSKTPGSALI